jgi:hypothetical protein
MARWFVFIAAIATAAGVEAVPLSGTLEMIVQVVAVLVAARNRAITPKPKEA